MAHLAALGPFSSCIVPEELEVLPVLPTPPLRANARQRQVLRLFGTSGPVGPLEGDCPELLKGSVSMGEEWG